MLMKNCLLINFFEGVILTMKKKKSIDSIDDLPITTISFLTTEGNETGDWSSQKLTLNYEKCNRCGLCWMYCPDNAIRAEKENYRILIKYCKGCGICVKECPKDAISMTGKES